MDRADWFARATPARTGWCAGCGAAWFCGAECQAEHWQRHLPSCRVLRGARDGMADGLRLWGFQV